MHLHHLERNGAARMMDISKKNETRREARAEAWVDVGSSIAEHIERQGSCAKGGVFETARLAGIMASKRTSELIPLCHPLLFDIADIDIHLNAYRVHITARIAGEARTGFEMEALTAVSVAALTVYDMVKSAGKGATIGPIRLLEKAGGKSGNWKHKEQENGTD